MQGDFRITIQLLKDLGACRDGQRNFMRAFPDGAGYQETLDRCAEEGRVDFGMWLLDKLGATEDVRTFDEDVDEPEKIILFAGAVEFKRGANVMHLIVKCGIRAGEGIRAGRGIIAGWGISAGLGILSGWVLHACRAIDAGRCIQACDGIRAGIGFGVFAGLQIKVALWSEYAVVTAKTKPENLISGYWKPLEEVPTTGAGNG